MTLETQTTGRTYAQQIETSVKEKNGTNYEKVLSEVHEYMHKNPSSAKELQSSVIDQLKADRMYGQVTLFEVKDRFESMDFMGNGVLNKAEISAYKRSIPSNELEQVFLDDQTSSMNANVGLVKYGIDRDLQSLADKEERRTLINHFFQQPGAGQPSLYERLADGEGNIPPSSIKHLMSADQSLSDLDKRTLKLMYDKDNGTWFMNDYSVDRLKNLCAENEADFGVKAAPPSSDQTPVPVVPAGSETRKDVTPSEQTAPPGSHPIQPNTDAPTAPVQPPSSTGDALLTTTPRTNSTPTPAATSDSDPNAKKAPTPDDSDHKPAPTEPGATKSSTNDGSSRRPDASGDQQKQNDVALANAATIQKKNESYAHCALRLLALAGVHDPSGKQLKALAHLLWKTNGSKRAGELHVHERLMVTDEVKQYLSDQHH